MLAAGCIDRRPTAIADRDAGPAIAMASGDTITIATTIATTITATITATIATTVTITVTTTVPSTGSSTATSSAATAPTPTSAATVRERGGCCQDSDHQSEHEHAESCHVAPPP